MACLLLVFLTLILIPPGQPSSLGVLSLDVADECINANCRPGYGWPGHPFLADPWGPMVLPALTSKTSSDPTTAGSGEAVDPSTTNSSLADPSATLDLPPFPSSDPTTSSLDLSNSSTADSSTTSLTESSTEPLSTSSSLKPSSSSPSSLGSASGTRRPRPSSARFNVSIPSSTMVSTSGPASQSQIDIQAFLAGHNSVRAVHGAAPLAYSQDLAAKAQQWANGCVFQHSGGTLGPFGENLAAGTGGGFGIPQAIQSWTDEASQYNANNPQPSHFTQVVWKATTEVGCAQQACDGIFPSSFGKAHFFVCEYSPQGNVIGAFGANVQA